MNTPKTPDKKIDAADNPTTEDLLNYKSFAFPIAEKIASADENSTPMTVGIFGEWGMGKTSFLMMIDEALQSRGVTPIWFNAWRYEREENLWSALLQRVLSQARVQGPWWRRVSVKLRIFKSSLDLRSGSWHVAKLVLTFLIRLLLFLIALTIVFSWSKADIEGFLQRYIGVVAQSHALLALALVKLVTGILAIVVIKPEAISKLFSAKLKLDFSAFKRKRSYQARIAFLDEFSEEFRRIVRLIGKGKPLVVIIDDLDRCLPEKAIQVLEAIKLFLDVKGCVFLLAVDQEVVESAIAVKYKDVLAVSGAGNGQSRLSTFLGENYFEKIIQLPFVLPPLARDDIGRLVSKLWQDDNTKACAEIFAAGLPPNPRKVKRNLQTFFLLHQLAKNRIDDGIIKASLLAKMVIIQNQFREVYRDLATTPNLMEALEDHFRRGPRTNEGEDSDTVSSDPILSQRLETYAVRYPKLREIFVQVIGPDDTFKGAPINDYVFFVKAVTEIPITPDKSISDDRETNVRQYFSYLVQQSKTFPVLAEADTSSKRADLSKLFVEPRLANMTSDGIDDSSQLKPSELLKQSGRILILGSPGTGKTSLLKYFTLLLLKETDDRNASKGTNFSPALDRIPILMPASHLANQARLSGPGSHDALKLIEAHYLQLNIPITAADLHSFFEQGRCVLLVDGLDEVPEPEYPLLVESLEFLTNRYPTSQYVASTRTKSLSRGSSPLIGFDSYEILPLDDDQVNEFIFKASSSKERGSKLAKLLSSNPQLKAISRNPLFLSIIVTLYSQTNTLPVSLLGAIDEYVELTLGRWDQIRGTNEAVRSVPRHMVKPALAGIALHMHEAQMERIRKTEAIDLICQQISTTQVESAELLYQLQNREGLFNEIAPGIYEFVHLLLKEFLTAEAIIAQPNPVSIALEHSDDGYWSMAIQFVAGRLGDWNSEHFTELINGLADINDPNRMKLAAECFLMSPSAAPHLRDKLLEDFEQFRANKQISPEVKAQTLELEKRMRESFSNS